MTTVDVPAAGAEYAAYRQVLAEEATRPPSEWTFKRNLAFRQILEHVSLEQGHQYAAAMADELPGLLGVFHDIARANDRLGAPPQRLFHEGVICSPSNLRYLWQALQIWRHLESLGLKDASIIEIGGGYGGLALFLKWLFPGKFRHYTIVDLPEACAIQAAFAYELGFDLKTIDGTDAQALAQLTGANNFLVSAYGFSEFSPEVRAWYEVRVIPHCAHGWLVWNVPPVYPFTAAPLTVEPEDPLTGPFNKVVRF